MKSDAHLYAKISNEIRHQIDSGKYLSGDRLPPERKLCEEFGVSRITVRQALEKLEDLNIIARKQGKGTYILPFEYGKLPEIFSQFTGKIEKAGERPATKMLDIVRMNSDMYLHQKMGLEVDTPIYKLSRLRMADERPLLLEYSFIPYTVAPDLDRFNFGKLSLYQVLEQDYSVKIDQAFETLKPISLNKKDAALLERAEGAIAMNLERFAYANEQAVEFTSSLVVDDKYKYTVDLI